MEAYDYDIYFNIVKNIIPEILRDAHKKGIQFLVKGGKAVQAYTRGAYIESPDWDCVVNDQKLHEYVKKELKRYLPKEWIFEQSARFKGMTLIQIGLNEQLLYLDILLDESYNLNKIKVFEGIPYLACAKLKEDLRITLIDRKARLADAQEDIFRDEETFLKEKKKKDEDSENSVKESVDNIKETLKKYKIKQDDLEYIFAEIDDIKDIIKQTGFTFDDIKVINKGFMDFNLLKKKTDLTEIRYKLLSNIKSTEC
jgi:hypothetical protein